MCKSVQDVLKSLIRPDYLPSLQMLLNEVFSPRESIAELAELRELEETLGKCAEEMNLHASKEFVQTALQLHSGLKQWKSVILVGPPGKGKSCIYRVLAAALGRLKRENTECLKVLTHSITPESLPLEYFFGQSVASNVPPYIENKQNIFKEGILQTVIKKITEDTSAESMHWIVLHASSNLQWIERMRYLLEGNDLILDSGEYLHSPYNSRFILE
ncbi:hypothetical protein IE077_002068, partial [Cardiosporidium cionae]